MTMESLIRKSWDYEINLVNGVYYGINSRNQVIDADATAVNVLTACIADAPATGAVINIHPDFDADGSTLTINKSNISIVNFNARHIAGNTWTTPRITKILLTPGSEALKNIIIYGLNLREVEMRPGVTEHNYPVDHIFLEKCQIRPTSTSGQRGIRMTSGGESEDYTYFVYLIDCAIKDYMDQSGINRGAISVESTHDGNGQYYFIRLDYKPFASDCTTFCVSGRCIMTNFIAMSNVNISQTGLKFMHLPDGGRATDLRITHSLFEQHVAMTMFTIDASPTSDHNLIVDFSHNTFSLTSGQTCTFITNNEPDAGDWVAGMCNGIDGTMNRVKVNPGDLAIGTQNANANFDGVHLTDMRLTVGGGLANWP